MKNSFMVPADEVVQVINKSTNTITSKTTARDSYYKAEDIELTSDMKCLIHIDTDYDMLVELTQIKTIHVTDFTPNDLIIDKLAPAPLTPWPPIQPLPIIPPSTGTPINPWNPYPLYPYSQPLDPWNIPHSKKYTYSSNTTTEKNIFDSLFERVEE